MHTISFGLGDTHYTGVTSVTADWDNVGFVNPVPEPSSVLLGVFGFGLVGVSRRLRRG